ncbi:myb-like transcription factor family protein [Striga hermonthica]|uniref:Myb-like transcription factor family protein n=1 Tax=Striga hermonthica TaxID=68872 RepID=A0A9N7NER2_STRHE|nr:myb-like transcription factor family protein [Striga hermonthica]
MAISRHSHSILPEKVQRCQDYMQALEEERCKIQVFKRELPLCLELVTQAIESCKQQLSGTTTTTECNQNGQSESSEETSSDLPAFEEFIPIKRASSLSEGCEEQEAKKQKIDADNVVCCDLDGNNGGDKTNIKKSDWLRSVQLWNQNTDLTSSEDIPRKVEVNKGGSNGAFHPFKKDKAATTSHKLPEKTPAPPASTSSTVGTGGGSGGGGNNNKKEEKEGNSRKARRCWSNELHQKFLEALNQLGGSHLATPKQIRELMKVDGLTNDEVKSHLQKYRLHTRRPSPSMQNTATTNASTQAPQFVVVTGGLWMPPEYTTAAMGTKAADGAAPNRIYAPVATLPPPFQEKSCAANQRQLRITSNSGDLGSHNEQDGVRSESPTASSSTHARST